jgi:two-component system response regulator DesR
MIKILIAEDQAMVRGALVALLNMEEGLQVVAQVENGKQALAALKETPVDILVSDIEMPEMTGIELAEKVAVDFPDIKVVIVTTFGRAGYVKRALSAGVKAFLLKDSPSEKLAASLAKVMQGQKVIDAELAISALDDLDPLSEKERKALKFAEAGKSTADIAKLLFLSEGTVRNYLSEAISKLHATNRVDAARIARQKGWL